eukprot:TRINITY_DN32179_c0_g1_i1.p1 TRINITY_DN32179_c0_g1~~TRINITY_DN32179_c0_g1_i1.p1  ORF type:complete len:372 (-),score=60.50 TRINITY_DN32179_c0_g1_i1:81-1196(-)
MSKFLKSVFKKKEKKTKGAPESDDEDDSQSSSPERRMSKEDFDVISLLGKGAFGKVILVRKKDTGQQYAMKVIFKQNVLDNGRIQDLFSERSVLRRAKHPFIVHLEYTFQSEHKLFFVMEYLQGGDLDTYLNQSEGKRFDEEKARFYAAEVLLALQYLHEHSIIYRDLKPENILLDAKGHACLSDFGLSKDFEGAADALDMRANSFVGSPFYVSPDVLRQRKYGNAVDWWSFGVLLFRMVTGTVPFKGANIRAVFESILHSKVDLAPFPWVSEVAQDLITGLLEKDEAKRLTGLAVKNHPFFNGVDWVTLYNKASPPPRYLPIVRKAAPVATDAGLDDVGRSPPTSIGTPQQKLFDGFSYANGPTLSASPQ